MGKKKKNRENKEGKTKKGRKIGALNQIEKEENMQDEPVRYRDTPREEAEIKQLKNRLSRMTGQLNGISRMLDEGRYCGDILTQVAAVESALQNFGYVVLRDHLDACVTDEIRKGNDGIMDETVELIRKLK
ncbi:MAG: metal-sensing transcriptional repressor [Lachnospiraceae bacterium]|jgi:DNA-binding FrmR family transcriptional regulator|nr:metal-sensing transcriptional repressor [Lachnospiraceae bacterium]